MFCHGNHLLGALPTYATCPWVRITHFIPDQECGAAEGVLPPPLPHSSAGLAPLALVTSGCWALSLCGCEHTHTHTHPTHTPHTHTHAHSACTKTHIHTQHTHTHTHTQHVTHTHNTHIHTYTHTHTQHVQRHTHTHTFKRRHPGAGKAPLRARGPDAGHYGGPHLFFPNTGSFSRIWLGW